eukprot:scaffold1697_cov180-Amphora_coffeaeformis.AAC.40
MLIVLLNPTRQHHPPWQTPPHSPWKEVPKTPGPKRQSIAKLVPVVPPSCRGRGQRHLGRAGACQALISFPLWLLGELDTIPRHSKGGRKARISD